jgi:hypothetical protein
MTPACFQVFMVRPVRLLICIFTQCSIVSGSDISQKHVLTLIRNQRFRPSLTENRSEWASSVVVLASCKECCNLNHRRGDRSFLHFLHHSYYWLGLGCTSPFPLVRLSLVSSLQLTYITKSYPHPNHFSVKLSPKWRQHVAPKFWDIHVHQEDHTVSKPRRLQSECGYCLLRNSASYSLLCLFMVTELNTSKKEAGSSAKTLLYIYQTMQCNVLGNSRM